MSFKIWTASAVVATIGVSAFAHGAATGVVRERMDGMSAMGKAVKELTPMMRGSTPFDADQVRVAAEIMILHGGEQMTRLFPEGTGDKPSEALPAVWDDWAEFTELAMQLQVYAEGMKQGADNGIGGPAEPGATMMMGMDTSSAMGGNAMGSSEEMTLEMIAAMPTDKAFGLVAGTCSACHQKFRAEEG